MTDWWQKLERRGALKQIAELRDAEDAPLVKAMKSPEDSIRRPDGSLLRLRRDLIWMMRVAGALAIVHGGGELHPSIVENGVANASDDAWKQIIHAAIDLAQAIAPASPKARIYSISLNREASPTVYRSTLAIKADAARRLFDIKCNELTWAVIDSGIDATHPAFRLRKGTGEPIGADPWKDADGEDGNGTRIKATYDFTGLHQILDVEEPEDLPAALQARLGANDDLRQHLKDLYDDISGGRTIDWRLLEPLLRVPHTKDEYRAPGHDHGTHVAGILAGDWRTSDRDSGLENNLVGVCPDLWLYDLRVLDEEGRGDEFALMAALQFARHLNATNDYVSLHGVNLSLSIPHDVANYACGRTPICDECERVVSSGVVVVAAAGNQGYRKSVSPDGVMETYNSISITDPGNADLIITVGATHRFRPHTYGVSYFSSRGPTGDGRLKPDLVAPGEKISAPILNDSYGLKDGTSMAAPHVSGACALLMARHNELVGRPSRVKQILCSTATDLGRERYFQGAGMLDVLRALQSV
ncbi:MAG: S8 family serine peptidase [Acidobacteria bacterium]|nr:S8 family serine peptidase [Acidobacteriota bacterium]